MGHGRSTIALMSDSDMSKLQKRKTREPTVVEQWLRDGWFFLSLLCVLFWSIPGALGALTSYVCLRIALHKVSQQLAIGLALTTGGVAILAARALLDYMA